MSKSSNKKEVITEQQRQKQEFKQMKKIELTNLKQDILSLREQVKHLIGQKINVQKVIQRQSQKFMTESYQLQKVTKVQEEELTDLQNKYKTLQTSFFQAKNKKQTEYKYEIQQLLLKKKGQKQVLVKQQNALSAKIQYLKRFKIREKEYQEALNSLLQRKQIMKQNQRKDIDKIKNQHQNKRIQIKEITNKQIQNIQDSELSKIRQKLTKEQQIKRENQIMTDQIQLCLAQKSVINQQCQILSQEMSHNSSKNSGQTLNIQANQTYQRSLRVIKLQGKIAKLKQYMAQQLQKQDKHLKQTELSYIATEKDLQQKLEKLKNTMKLKSQDLKKLRACSKMVLNQRSSLQCYLLQVFHENPEISFKDPAKVNEILRKLFVKINSKKPVISYKNYLGQGGLSSQISTNSLAD